MRQLSFVRTFTALFVLVAAASIQGQAPAPTPVSAAVPAPNADPHGYVSVAVGKNTQKWLAADTIPPRIQE